MARKKLKEIGSGTKSLLSIRKHTGSQKDDINVAWHLTGTVEQKK